MTVHPNENPISNANIPVITNLTLVAANFEYSHSFPLNTRKFQIKPRSSSAVIKLAFTSGESGTSYITVPPGGYWEDLVGLTSVRTLYIQSPTAGTIAEILSWS
jgi:hypothetical protein